MKKSALDKVVDNTIYSKHSGFVSLHHYIKGWKELDIPQQYKTPENKEMYCYLRYSGLNAAIMFKDKIAEMQIEDSK